MIVNEVDGDLIKRFREGYYQAIAHGCNCQKRMGAGIALDLSNRFPLISETDNLVSDPQPGGMSVCILTEGIVFNLYTQLYPGLPQRGENRLEMIRESFEALETWVHNKGYDTNSFLLGIPKIGSGLAGGNWKEISKTINEASGTISIEVVNFTK